MNPLLDAALCYRASGLCPLPAGLASKYPTLSEWGPYRDHMPTEVELRQLFAAAEAICILTGRASDGLEGIDFDDLETYLKWEALVTAETPGLFAKLVIESTQNDGRHVPYQMNGSVPGSTKLAERYIDVESDAPVIRRGKEYKPVYKDGGWKIRVTLIETRGEGGLLVCAPSPGYVMQRGQLSDLPILSDEEREILIRTARSLTEIRYEPEPVRLPSSPDLNRPGDDYSSRADVRPLLEKHGWTLARPGENEYWRRPGKTQGWSATLKNQVFYVFSSNAVPFESNRAYSPFSIYTLLEHGGDYSKAAATLRSEGYGQNDTGVQGVDLSGLLLKLQTEPPEPSNILTPKQLFEFDVANDPNKLLGERWLCRSGSCLVVGQTGIGKSSFSMQAALSWALGAPLFGIQPVRPLKSLIVQAENDPGDLAEMFTGVAHGLGYLDRLDLLDENVVFVSETAQSGRTFHPWIRALILRYKPDLVWIDPLFSFLGGSVSDQEVVSAFLRNGLGTIAQETGCTWMIVHHANKPPKDPLARSAMTAGDYSYLGAGSAELANWARAVLVLRETEDGIFELRASKRGKRAGLLDNTGQETTHVFLRHGTNSIYWERCDDSQVGMLQAVATRSTAQEWSLDGFLATFLGPDPQTLPAIQARANEMDITDNAAANFVRKAHAMGRIHRWRDGTTVGYATIPQPRPELPVPKKDPLQTKEKTHEGQTQTQDDAGAHLDCIQADAAGVGGAGSDRAQ